MHQVILVASAGESLVSAWDISTGTQQTAYKSNSSGKNSLCKLGDDYFAAAQTGKDAIQFWSWHKDQPIQRSFTQERVVSLTAAFDGSLIVGGGLSGNLYVWDVGSGRLLATWPAHYKAVNALKLLVSGILVSGSEDTLVSAWLLAEVLDYEGGAGSQMGVAPQPLHSWSDHTLPVTALAVGEAGLVPLVISVSLDHSVKIHRIDNGSLLASAALPTSLHAVALDLGEHALYLGGGDGSVYELSLMGDSHSWSAPVSSAVAGLGLPPGVSRMEGHTRVVNCLCLSLDGELLVSGSDDGTVRVWDLRSRQTLHVISPPSKLSVTSTLVVPRPRHMTGMGAAQTGPRRISPLSALAKYPSPHGSIKAWDGPVVILDGSLCSDSVSEATESVLHFVAGCGLVRGEKVAVGVESESDRIQGAKGGVDSDGEVQRLKEELAAAHKVAAEWRQNAEALQKLCSETLSAKD